MPVTMKKQHATLECDSCGCTLELHVGRGAAPELRACEKAHADHGWGYIIGLFAILMGPGCYCPVCARPGEHESRA